MSFNLDEWLKERDPKILSSTGWEKHHSALVKPKTLEGVGLDPTRVLGQGDYTNYLYDRAKAPFERPSAFDRPSPFAPRPLQPPGPFGR